MIVDPNKCVIFNCSIIEEKEDTLEEKKLKRLINLRDKCDDRYGMLTIYSLIALLAVLVNAMLQGIPLYLKYLVLISISLSIPLGIYLVGNHVRLLESTILEKKKEFISKSELFSLVFETKEEEQVDRVTVNGAVINPTNASNKNYGLK
jgi:hypothetical protein